MSRVSIHLARLVVCFDLLNWLRYLCVSAALFLVNMWLLTTYDYMYLVIHNKYGLQNSVGFTLHYPVSVLSERATGLVKIILWSLYVHFYLDTCAYIFHRYICIFSVDIWNILKYLRKLCLLCFHWSSSKAEVLNKGQFIRMLFFYFVSITSISQWRTIDMRSLSYLYILYTYRIIES